MNFLHFSDIKDYSDFSCTKQFREVNFAKPAEYIFEQEDNDEEMDESECSCEQLISMSSLSETGLDEHQLRMNPELKKQRQQSLMNSTQGSKTANKAAHHRIEEKKGAVTPIALTNGALDSSQLPINSPKVQNKLFKTPHASMIQVKRLSHNA